eukprot:TRINITY_DN2419_c0_g1_i11.p1 TRINITY_DN2419_c0_g1~~TRINITY_DN2419_c0_g1_i11.p1  ORF type:complete len:185 (+),score=53.29 TRINITY_DN2419_c0_g1_i11:34-555(+)
MAAALAPSVHYFLSLLSGHPCAPPAASPPCAATAPCAAPGPEKPVHSNVVCDSCNKTIVGDRFKCMVCEDYDLCSACSLKEGVHNADHKFLKIPFPIPFAFSVAQPVPTPAPAAAPAPAPAAATAPGAPSLMEEMLATLEMMGFVDRAVNQRLLVRHNYVLEDVVDALASGRF